MYCCIVTKVDFDCLENDSPEYSAPAAITLGATPAEAGDKAAELIHDFKKRFAEYQTSWRPLWRNEGQKYPIYETAIYPVNEPLLET